ncbi:hypothetical protein [Salimicrobium album]|uniref:YopX protein domain-containing protein n=1 Tax=Salimicrobium album TaxID=50717 RepID=A0A1H3DCR2_9BACI|nr:hypothetical protein [Salimicrobium album]SDX64110.1 hypothetical protein SAMN04488081_0912 [Salimicrobium album]
MKDLEHPDVTEVNRTGGVNRNDDHIYGTDALGNEVFVGDEIYWFDDGHYYLVEAIREDTKEVIRTFGGQLHIAGRTI